VDAREKRLLGGCAYHVMDPTGKPYHRLPADPTEADARLKARFVPRGGSTVTVRVPPEPRATETPCTLDLRLQPEQSA